jgi:2-phospho-L-lactate transferase/gluconeogenesis factor (CofD/UPF0052 family)
MSTTQTGFGIIANGHARYFYQATSRRTSAETARVAVAEAARIGGHVVPMTESHYNLLREMAEDVAALAHRAR